MAASETQRLPRISVVVPAESAGGIRTLVEHLRRQTIAPDLELVLVSPSGSRMELEPELVGELGDVRVVRLEESTLANLPGARVVGVRHARAELVAFSETHCFPEPGWAEALLAAFRNGRAAVGPALVNGNPATALSWCNLLIDYGTWVAPVEAGETDDLPGHNSCYRRRDLLDLGDRLEDLLAAEFVMHAEMRERGRVLYLEPAARTAHHNVTRLGSWLPERFHAGRSFAAGRCRHWPRRRRALYAIGSPLIPLVRAARLWPVLRRVRPATSRPRLAAALALGLAVNALGECFAFALGSGSSAEKTAGMELNRFEHVRAADRPGSVAAPP